MSITVKVNKSELGNLAYSIWTGNPNLYRSNDEVALKLLIELYGRCASVDHGEQCILFSGHPSDTKHRWTDGCNGIYWAEPRPQPVTWKD